MHFQPSIIMQLCGRAEFDWSASLGNRRPQAQLCRWNSLWSHNTLYHCMKAGCIFQDTVPFQFCRFSTNTQCFANVFCLPGQMQIQKLGFVTPPNHLQIPDESPLCRTLKPSANCLSGEHKSVSQAKLEGIESLFNEHKQRKVRRLPRRRWTIVTLFPC